MLFVHAVWATVASGSYSPQHEWKDPLVWISQHPEHQKIADKAGLDEDERLVLLAGKELSVPLTLLQGARHFNLGDEPELRVYVLGSVYHFEGYSGAYGSEGVLC